MKRALLAALYRFAPFDLRGDCLLAGSADSIRISCVINFYGRLDLLSGILHSLTMQDYDRERFEVVLVEDQGGTDGGKLIAREFSDRLNIVYLPLDRNFGKMGYSRNFGLGQSRGEIILFLDDDTVILQNNFLATLDLVFSANSNADAVVPFGSASFAVVTDRYDFHDPFFMTSRCTAYRRNVLKELGGFISDFVGQEDVEFITRFSLAGKSSLNCAELHYFHPPLLVPNFRKPKAVGHSFCKLRKRYPFFLWLMVLINCSRHAPFYLIPIRRFREMGRFGIGFLLGILLSLLKRDGFHYS